jgi:hypothetical protein
MAPRHIRLLLVESCTTTRVVFAFLYAGKAQRDFADGADWLYRKCYVTTLALKAIGAEHNSLGVVIDTLHPIRTFYWIYVPTWFWVLVGPVCPYAQLHRTNWLPISMFGFWGAWFLFKHLGKSTGFVWRSRPRASRPTSENVH